MAYSYNTTTSQITITSTSTTRQLYDDVQNTFAGSAYMQYLMPMTGSIQNALYVLANGWTITAGINYLNTGGLIDTAINNRWSNVVTISGNSFTGIQLYYNQTGTPVNFASTGLVNMLLQVRSAGVDINSESYTVYQRTYGQQYSQFTTTASSGGVDTIPLSNVADPQVSIAQATVDAYADLSIRYSNVYRSAFDGLASTKFTLNGALTNVATTITCNETVSGVAPASGTLQIGNEVIAYTGTGANTFTGCTRGQYFTTAASYSTLSAVSTNTKLYTVLVQTSNTNRRLSELYNWIQSKLTKNTDIDTLVGGHIGQLATPLVSYTGTMVTSTGVWVEGFSTLDVNSISYTDASSNSHTPPLTVPVVVNVSLTGCQVLVTSLNNGSLSDTNYTPANITATLINQTVSTGSASVSVVYTTSVPVRVVVRKAGYQQFSLYTTITSSGLSVTAINATDTTY